MYVSIFQYDVISYAFCDNLRSRNENHEINNTNDVYVYCVVCMTAFSMYEFSYFLRMLFSIAPQIVIIRGNVCWKISRWKSNDIVSRSVTLREYAERENNLTQFEYFAFRYCA
ncbi:unnamed protein product [Rotaria socialis]